MKALVLKQVNGNPEVDEFQDPVAGENEKVVTVTAAALNPVDRLFASSSDMPLPRVVGTEGVGTIDDGSRVYFGRTVAPFGSVAERSIAKAAQLIPLPEQLTTEAALTLGVSGFAGWLPLSWKANLQVGESVLVLGATGAQGQVAVQAAKLLGAGHVVAAGRNREALEALKGHGADSVAVLEGDIAQTLKQAAPEKGYDVVVDSVFGTPFEQLLQSGTLHATSRIIVIGGSASQEATLAFRQLQGIEGATICGYSSTFVPDDIRRQTFLAMAQHVIAGTLQVETESFSLDQAVEAWAKQASGPHHKILVSMQ